MDQSAKISTAPSAKSQAGPFSNSSLQQAKASFSDPDSERRYWGKILFRKWLFLYLSLWVFLTVALMVDNDPIRSAALAMIIALTSSLFITLILGSFIIFQARRQLGTISAEEKLVALVFGMALSVLYPFCWHFGLGWSVALALTLLLYQSLALLSRYSKFTDKLFGGDQPKLFPDDSQPTGKASTKSS